VTSPSPSRGLALGVALCLVGSLAAAACGGTTRTSESSLPVQTQKPTNIEPRPADSQPSGPKPTVLIEGLAGPTQIAFGPSGTWLVAELGGEEPSGNENGSTGRVLLIDPATKAQRVLAKGLDKPTGVAWINGVVWVMVRRGIVKLALPSAPLPSLMTAPAATAAPEVSVVLADLPFNGRSEGTITSLANGTFLYETTGNIVGNPASGESEPQPGSGTLWSFDPQTNQSTVIAVGLKNSYAHVVLSDGRIATTEIGDNIALEPLDEVNILKSVVDKASKQPQSFGWPVCDASGKPLAKQDTATCSAATPALRAFPAHVTPTGIAQYNDDLYVSLFVSGQIMRLPSDALPTSKEPVEKRPAEQIFASGLEGPHTLLLDGTRLLVTETTSGRIVAFDLPS
jgi:glucose/arabinose dehydrogenase